MNAIAKQDIPFRKNIRAAFSKDGASRSHVPPTVTKYTDAHLLVGLSGWLSTTVNWQQVQYVRNKINGPFAITNQELEAHECFEFGHIVSARLAETVKPCSGLVIGIDRELAASTFISNLISTYSKVNTCSSYIE